MDEELKCSICLDFAVKAVETNCCHQIQCLLCVNTLDICPNCRANLSFKASHILRRIIDKLPAVCPNEGCNINITRGELENHNLKCEFRVFICCSPNCEFQGNFQNIAGHIAAFHTLELVREQRKLFENDNTFIDRIKTVETTRGNGNARLGVTGKYYCGGPLNGNCVCCDGECGLSNGCNCLECMKLDVKVRRLPRNWFINRSGYACRKGTTGLFYCGRKVEEHYDSDGFCGPTNGPNCHSCTKIDEQYQTRYEAVWDN